MAVASFLELIDAMLAFDEIGTDEARAMQESRWRPRGADERRLVMAGDRDGLLRTQSALVGRRVHVSEQDVRFFNVEQHSPSYIRNMIAKPYADREESDRRRSAGRRAERQMVHYLDRHFGDAKDVFVLHDLRVVLEGEVAQMDHLVLHAFGAAIVESKSVSTSVRINAAGEWERQWDGRWQGMADPVLQGERQGMLLKKLLLARQAELLDKAVFGLLQGTFKHMALDVFAAISDDGTILRAEKGQAPRVLKADAVPNAILDAIVAYRSSNDALRSSLKEARTAPRVFKDAEMMRVAHFLRTQHVEPGEVASAGDTVMAPSADADGRGSSKSRQSRSAPAVGVATPRPPTHDATPASAGSSDGDLVVVVCKACGGGDLEARIGRYGPYGRCRACGADTSVRMRCTSCGDKVRVERATGGFGGVCAACGRSVLVRVGP